MVQRAQDLQRMLAMLSSDDAVAGFANDGDEHLPQIFSVLDDKNSFH